MKISPLQFLTRAQQDRMTELRAEIASIREDAAADAADFAKLSLSAHGAAVTAWSKRSVKCGGSARRNVKVIRITEHSVYTSNGRGKPVRWRLSDGRAIGIGMGIMKRRLSCSYCGNAPVWGSYDALIKLCHRCSPYDRTPVDVTWADGLSHSTLREGDHGARVIARAGNAFASTTLRPDACDDVKLRAVGSISRSLRMPLRGLALAIHALQMVKPREWLKDSSRTIPQPPQWVFHPMAALSADLLIDALANPPRLSEENSRRVMVDELKRAPIPPTVEWAEHMRDKYSDNGVSE